MTNDSSTDEDILKDKAAICLCAEINFGLTVQTRQHHCGPSKNVGLHKPGISEWSSALKYHNLLCGLAGQRIHFPFCPTTSLSPLCVHAMLDESLSAQSSVECQETNNTRLQQVHTHLYAVTCSGVLWASLPPPQAHCHVQWQEERRN